MREGMKEKGGEGEREVSYPSFHEGEALAASRKKSSSVFLNDSRRHFFTSLSKLCTFPEGGREKGKEGGRERGREGGSEGGREGEREGGREGGKEGERGERDDIS